MHDDFLTNNYALLYKNIFFEVFNCSQIYDFFLKKNAVKMFMLNSNILNIPHISLNSYDFFFFKNNFFKNKVNLNFFLGSSYILIPTNQQMHSLQFDFFEEEEQEEFIFLDNKSNVLNDFYLDEDLLFFTRLSTFSINSFFFHKEIFFLLCYYNFFFSLSLHQFNFND